MMAARVGVSEQRFWKMLPRELERLVRAYRERMEARQKLEEARFYNTLNAFGAVMAGDKWKWVKPKEAGGLSFEERLELARARARANRKRRQQKQDAG